MASCRRGHRRPCSRRPRPSRTTRGSCRSSGGRRRPASRSRSCPTGSASSSSRRSRPSASGSCRSSRPGPRSPAARASIAFPNGHPTCFVCGTCKRNRVLAHQAAGRAVVFIGDGESDRYAAGYSDVVFAKRSLVRICLEAGWPFQRWTEFARDRRRGSPTTLAAWRGRSDDPAGARARHPFFCGPEVWGEGLVDPPAEAWPPSMAADGG